MPALSIIVSIGSLLLITSVHQLVSAQNSPVDNKSILGLIGLPFIYMAQTLQILVFLSLALNGFLFFKIMS